MSTLEKLKVFKNNTKEKLIKIKNYIIEKYNKNIFTIQFILLIVSIILMICSLFMTKNVYKRIDNLSKQTAELSDQNDDLSKRLNELSDQYDDLLKQNNNISKQINSVKNDIKNSAKNNTNSSKATASTPSSKKPTSSKNTTTSSSKKPSSSKPSESSTVKTNTSSDLDLLACVIYQEAGGNGSCDNCRRRVADVVLNRVADSRFPNTIREVLTAKNQYGRFYYTGVKWPSRAKNVNEKSAVARAYRIAEEVLNGKHSDIYGKGYVWQAAFRQGKSQVYCCGEYFGK